MLFFAAKPDKAFEEIILTGLTCKRDVLKDQSYSDEDAMSAFSDRICKLVFKR